MARRVAVVGAGYAGMAAAVTLAAAGAAVTVLESGPVPGGRARRVHAGGRDLDNGQHILVGAYRGLFALMRQVGVPQEAVLRVPLELRYAGAFSLRSLWLPAPLGVLAGLLLARGISWPERVGAVRFMTAMRRSAFRLPADMPVDALLARHGQDGAIGRYLWRPLCVSALNTPPAIASSNVLLAVLRDALLGEDGASDLVLPRVDLSGLFPEPAARYVAQHGGEVRLRTPVRNLEALRRDHDAVIVAVGPHQLKALLPEAPEHAYQPIYTCYLQYGEAARLPFPMLGLADGLVQWVFDRGALLGEKGRFACVISAQGDHQQLDQAALAERCHRELREAGLAQAEPQWSQVIAEKRATIACPAGLRRIPARMAGIVLAGDYTDPDYPPTLEAAVRSGVRAAHDVLH